MAEEESIFQSLVGKASSGDPTVLISSALILGLVIYFIYKFYKGKKLGPGKVKEEKEAVAEKSEKEAPKEKEGGGLFGSLFSGGEKREPSPTEVREASEISAQEEIKAHLQAKYEQLNQAAQRIHASEFFTQESKDIPHLLKGTTINVQEADMALNQLEMQLDKMEKDYDEISESVGSILKEVKSFEGGEHASDAKELADQARQIKTKLDTKVNNEILEEDKGKVIELKGELRALKLETERANK